MNISIKKIYAIIRYVWKKELPNIFTSIQTIAGPMILAFLYGLGSQGTDGATNRYLLRFLNLGIVYMFFISRLLKIMWETSKKHGIFREFLFSKATPHEIIIGYLTGNISINFLRFILPIIILFSIFNQMSTTNILMVFSMLLITATIVSFILLAVSIVFNKYRKYFTVIRLIFPSIFIISGCFFPPWKDGILGILSFLSPITHGINITHFIMKESIFYNIKISIIMLSVYMVAGYAINYYLIKKW